MGDRKSFPLRFDAGLYEALREWAAQEMRSVNGQIEFLLTRAVAERRRRASDDSHPPSEKPGMPHREGP